MEKIPTKVFKSAGEGSLFVANEIKAIIHKNNLENKPTIIGLASGASPFLLYQQLVNLHKEGLSFQNVVTFNLDEYYPMDSNSLLSNIRFMNENLFNHLDIKKENIFIPDGTIKIEDVESYCENYEKKIASFGGLDIQILGIGRTGHIGFNEPGSSPTSLTRLVTLDKKTRIDVSGDFRNEEQVPRTAITVGIDTIVKSKQVFLMAWGENKANIVAKAVEGPITWQIPATFLQNHPKALFVIDEAASNQLEIVKTPWLVGTCEWDWKLTLKAVCWLSDNLKKPVLKLTDENYNEVGMGDLIAKYGSAYELNLKVFRHLRDTITGWPGGKPGTQDERRPERAKPFPKRALVFSPHPDDDVVSMGGTLIRLVDQGHDVHVAYQTTGSVGVLDDDVINQVNFVKEFSEIFKLQNSEFDNFYKEIREFLTNKNASSEDLDTVKKIKGLIRKVEAKAGCRYCGVFSSNIHFLNLPFYETGKKQKKQFNENDIQITMDLMNQIKPHQVFLAGDLEDPNGTHRICLDILIEALKRLNTTESWMKDCWVWMYRGTKYEWPIHEIEMAVPLSPEETVRKRQAIIKHKSQKELPVFPADDFKDKWQVAENRNKLTAAWYDNLGLPEYEGIEAFKRYFF